MGHVAQQADQLVVGVGGNLHAVAVAADTVPENAEDLAQACGHIVLGSLDVDVDGTFHIVQRTLDILRIIAGGIAGRDFTIGDLDIRPEIDFQEIDREIRDGDDGEEGDGQLYGLSILYEREGDHDGFLLAVVIGFQAHFFDILTRALGGLLLRVDASQERRTDQMTEIERPEGSVYVQVPGWHGILTLV